MRYSEIIKEIMNEYNLTQAGLSEILNVNQTTIGQWLSGKKKPSFDSILMIYEKFGITPNELFGIE
ncbi:MAG: helix-turn-helix transcriptional regulator [Christensenellales bacterium]